MEANFHGPSFRRLVAPEFQILMPLFQIAFSGLQSPGPFGTVQHPAVAENQPVPKQNRMKKAFADYTARLRAFMSRAGHPSDDDFAALALELFRLQFQFN